jgi:hypothetical protein
MAEFIAIVFCMCLGGILAGGIGAMLGLIAGILLCLR